MEGELLGTRVIWWVESGEGVMWEGGGGAWVTCEGGCIRFMWASGDSDSVAGLGVV